MSIKTKVTLEPATSASRGSSNYFESLPDGQQQAILRHLSQNRNVNLKYSPKLLDRQWAEEKDMIYVNNEDLDKDGIDDTVVYNKKKDGTRGVMAGFNGYRIKQGTYEADIELPEVVPELEDRKKLNHKMSRKVKEELSEWTPDQWGNYPPEYEAKRKEVIEKYKNNYPGAKIPKMDKNHKLKRWFEDTFVKVVWNATFKKYAAGHEDSVRYWNKLALYQELAATMYRDFLCDVLNIDVGEIKNIQRVFSPSYMSNLKKSNSDAYKEANKFKTQITKRIENQAQALKEAAMESKLLINIHGTSLMNKLIRKYEGGVASATE